MADHPTANRVEEIRDWQEREWEVSLRSCYSEENKAAHWLATVPYAFIFGLQIFEAQLEGIQKTLRRDLGLRGLLRWDPSS